MKKVTFLLLCSMYSFLLQAQTIHYVDQIAMGDNSGIDWANAFTDLQLAINSAEEGDEIWIKEGIYRPENEFGYIINKRLSLYGGFTGSESSLDERPENEEHQSILSGDLAGDDVIDEYDINRSDNSTHVLFIEDQISGTIIIDGFTFSGGHTQEGPSLTNHSNSGGAILTYSRIQLSNSTFKNNWGRKGGSIALIDSGTEGSEITNCSFINNKAGTEAGALYVIHNKNLKVSNCSFNNNEATENGGAAVFTDEELTSGPTDSLLISNCTFDSNKVIDGTGGAIRSENMNFVIENTLFQDNESDPGFGAAVCIYGPEVQFFIKESSFENNAATLGGALFWNAYQAKGTVSNCDFKENYAFFNGGSIYSQEAIEANIFNCQFNNNEAYNGAGAYFNGGITLDSADLTQVHLEQCLWESNSSIGDGAALYNSGVVVSKVIKNEFKGNSNNGFGGAISIIPSFDTISTLQPYLEISQSLFVNNSSFFGGYAVSINGINTEISNSVFLFNSTANPLSAGTINIYSTDPLPKKVRIVNSTISSNGGGSAGGIGQETAGDGNITLELQNNIIHNPGSQNYINVNSQPYILSKGGNFVTDFSMTNFMTEDDYEVPNGDPMFKDIFEMDLQLQGNSPCIDAGIEAGAPAYDYSGNPRIGQTDIGAFEYNELTSIDQLIKNSDQLKISPNPIQGQASIQINNEDNGIQKIMIFDLKGLLLWEKDILKETGTHEELINFNTFRPGTYILKVESNNSTLVKPIIKI